MCISFREIDETIFRFLIHSSGTIGFSMVTCLSSGDVMQRSIVSEFGIGVSEVPLHQVPEEWRGGGGKGKNSNSIAIEKKNRRILVEPNDAIMEMSFVLDIAECRM